MRLTHAGVPPGWRPGERTDGPVETPGPGVFPPLWMLVVRRPGVPRTWTTGSRSPLQGFRVEKGFLVRCRDVSFRPETQRKTRFFGVLKLIFPYVSRK